MEKNSEEKKQILLKKINEEREIDVLTKYNDLEKLQRSILFSAVNPDIIKEIINEMVIENFKEGSSISKEKDNSRMYIILEGSVKIFCKSDEHEVVFAKLSEGEFFGEIGMIMNKPSLMSISALTDCRVLIITMEDLIYLKKYYPDSLVEIYEAMMKTMCRRLDITDKRLVLKEVFKNVNKKQPN